MFSVKQGLMFLIPVFRSAIHGPKLKLNGQKRKTYLYAIIDNATRYVLHVVFYQ